MPREIINLGTIANDGNGDPLRECWVKVNTMTNEIYTAFGDGSNLNFSSLVSGINTELGGTAWQTGGAVVPVEDNGSQIVAAPTALNFTGTGVTVTDVGGVATIDISSGGTVDVVSNVATDTILGRTTVGSGDSEELTPAQVRTLLNVEDGATADQTGAEIVSAIDTELGGSTWQSGGGSVPVEDDSSQIVAAPTALNFTGAGVTVTDVGGVATIDVPGSGSGTSSQITVQGARAWTNDVTISTTGAWVNVTWFAYDYDTANFLDVGGANPTRVTIPSGVDKVRFHVSISKDSGGPTPTSDQWRLTKNSVILDPLSDGGFSLESMDNGYGNSGIHGSSAILDVVQNDYFELSYWQSVADSLFDVWFEIEVLEGSILGTFGGAIPAQDDGVEILANPSALNFTGTGVTVTDVGGVATIDISSGGTVDVVSNVAQDTILGRTSSGSGDSEELTPTQVRTLINVEDGATADQTGAEIVSAIDAELGGATWQTGGGSVPAQDDGVEIVATPTAFNFTGAGVTVTDVGGVATIDVPGGSGGGAIPAQDDGVEILAAPSALNFTGDGVTVTDNSGVADIDIPGTLDNLSNVDLTPGNLTAADEGRVFGLVTTTPSPTFGLLTELQSLPVMGGYEILAENDFSINPGQSISVSDTHLYDEIHMYFFNITADGGLFGGIYPDGINPASFETLRLRVFGNNAAPDTGATETVGNDKMFIGTGTITAFSGRLIWRGMKSGVPLSCDKVAGQESGDYFHHEHNVYKTVTEVRGLDFNTNGTEITNGAVVIVGVRNAVQIMPATYNYSGTPSGVETLGRFVVPVNARIRSGAQGQFKNTSNNSVASSVNINIVGGSTIGTISLPDTGDPVVSITSDTDLNAGDVIEIVTTQAETFVDLYGTLLLEGRG